MVAPFRVNVFVCVGDEVVVFGKQVTYVGDLPTVGEVVFSAIESSLTNAAKKLPFKTVFVLGKGVVYEVALIRKRPEKRYIWRIPSAKLPLCPEVFWNLIKWFETYIVKKVVTEDDYLLSLNQPLMSQFPNAKAIYIYLREP